MKYLLLFFALVVAMVGVGCTDAPVVPGTRIESFTLCTESAEDYSECLDEEPLEILAFVQDSGLDFSEIGFDNCQTFTIDHDKFEIGDEVTIGYSFRFADGWESLGRSVKYEITDLAPRFTVPCSD
jgi:hypothetical protein